MVVPYLDRNDTVQSLLERRCAGAAAEQNERVRLNCGDEPESGPSGERVAALLLRHHLRRRSVQNVLEQRVVDVDFC